MVKGKNFGTVIELNRFKYGRLLRDAEDSVFEQIRTNVKSLLPQNVLLPHRVWKVKFMGEGIDDCGGGFSESIAEMCDELQNGTLPLFITTPNGSDEIGSNRDRFIFNPAANHLQGFHFLGDDVLHKMKLN